SVVMALLLLVSSFVFAAETTEITVPSDVIGTAYEEAVTALVQKGIVTGDTDGKFNPEANLTRAQACIIVVKSMNPPVADVAGTATQSVVKSGFSDMAGYGWSEGYISYAVKNGVTKGYPDGTFKPGNKVTMNELVTMVLRAADFTDDSLGGIWPTNYMNKATELQLMTNLPEQFPTYATKWMAAQLDYNTLDKIEAANPPSETPAQGTDQDKPDAIQNVKAMTFTSSSFNSTITSYSGKTISKDVKVYTYGKKADYSATMTFTNKLSDYREDTVYKYKNVKTPAFYQLENGEITAMVLPMDVGFSGRAYGVFDDTITTMNKNSESVTGLVSLTATREITWLGKKGLSGVPSSTQYLQGEIYELNISDGEVQSIYKSSDAGKKGDAFAEISSVGAVFVTVDSFKNNVVTIDAADGGTVFEVNDNASVYTIDSSNPTEYKVGHLASIRAGVEIRAYDITDDDKPTADIVVVKN
ncbi:MAG: S-layer homology domain-containing protein, partial [Bacillota bacterium]